MVQLDLFLPEKISRRDASTKGLDLYYTGKSCKNGHMDYRYVSNASCVSCIKMKYKKWLKTNIKKANVYSKQHMASRRLDEYLQHAKPKWFDDDRYKKLEEEKNSIIKKTGVPMVIGFHIPLKGRTVCGLYSTDNMCIVSKSYSELRKNRWSAEKESQKYYEYLKNNGF